jgi:hypothetical protein
MNLAALNFWVLAGFVIALIAVGFLLLWFVIFKPASKARNSTGKEEANNYSERTNFQPRR